MFNTNVSPFGLLQGMVDIGQYLTLDNTWSRAPSIVQCQPYTEEARRAKRLY